MDQTPPAAEGDVDQVSQPPPAPRHSHRRRHIKLRAFVRAALALAEEIKNFSVQQAPSSHVVVCVSPWH